MANDISAQAGQANLPFGRLVIGALSRLGVDHFVLSPGSRSTPLALAVAALGDGFSTICLDERSAAFHALGRIKATRQPVALICTSGSAGAHYYPAIIEARETGLPLIVLTADRPPELRQCHHGQTIDQQKLFGFYPVFYAELPLPDLDSILMRQVREICRRAVESSVGYPGGPAHLNCPFREPFFNAISGDSELDQAILNGLTPVSRLEGTFTNQVELPQRTLILAGPRPWKDPQAELDALLELSGKRGFPILTDGSNPLRYTGESSASIIIHQDRIVRDEALWQSLAPEAVLLWGEPPTSKVLRQRLAAMDIPGFQIGAGKPGMNPFHGKIQWGGSSVASFVKQLNGTKGSYADSWLKEDARMEAALEAAMSQPHDLFEGDIHRLLGKQLPPGTPICFASSLAIRDAEWFMPRRETLFIPYSQRGANGIDGTLSLARGVAAGSRQAAALVTGDLAFLHDGNGLLGSGSDKFGLLVILINNNGGGIFEFLPVASERTAFERSFATPQKVDFKKLVEAHGAKHQLVESLDELQWALEVWNPAGVTVIEIPVDRTSSRDLHRRFIKQHREA
jgi:2-succinyl-5-enolpyruvyl-6-hydroxy-3-cyclohexene-1-carboxylate synthase